MRRALLTTIALAGLTGAAIAQVSGPDVAPPIRGSQDMPLPPGAPGGPAAPAAPGTPTTDGAAPAPGEQVLETLRPSSDLGENRIVHDQAYRALRSKDYKRAVDLFAKLATAQPEVLEYRLNYALSLYETGKLPESRELYDAILNSEPENIEALLAMARITCKVSGGEKDPNKKAEALEQARDALRKAARYGLNALRAIKNYPEFAQFKTDVTLQLDIIREPQQLRLELAGKDPFFNPLPTVYQKSDVAGPAAEGSDKSGLTGSEQENLVKRLEKLFEEIDPLVERNDFEALGKKWGEIDEILRQEKRITSIDLAPKFKELMKRHREKLPVIRSLLLRSYYTEGERTIEAMKDAVAAQDHQKVLDLWARLDQHAKKMIQTDEKFAQPATDLLTKGKPYEQIAQKLKEIEQIKLNVTAIVMGGGVSQAIVNNRILAEGDIVYDLNGNPIPELKVDQIKRRRLRFQYKGLAFEPRNQLSAK